MTSSTVERLMPSASATPLAGRSQAWLRFLTALLRALAVSMA